MFLNQYQNQLTFQCMYIYMYNFTINYIQKALKNLYIYIKDFKTTLLSFSRIIMFLNKLINKGYQAEQCQICQTNKQRLLSRTMLNLSDIIQFNVHNHIQQQGNYKESTNVKDAINTSVLNAAKIKKEYQIKMENGLRIRTGYVLFVRLIFRKFIKPSERVVQNDMAWNRDTTMSKEWLENIKKHYNKDKDYEYEHFLKLFYQNQQHYEQEVEIIDKDVVKGRTDSSVFNFSMREFFYTVKMDVDNKDSRQNIKNVLYALASRYDKIGYCQGMSGVAAFLLCFSSEKLAFTIYCDLLEYIYPQDFFWRSQYGVSLSGLLAETHFLQEYFVYILTQVKKPLLIKVRGEFYEDSQIDHFRTIIELVGSKALLSLFVGVLSFSNCIFVWQQIKQHRNFQVIEKAFLAIIYLNRQKILQNRSYKILEDIFERMTLEDFKQFYYDIQIDQNIRKQIIQQYHQGVSKKWSSKSDHQVKTLSKLTSLTNQQILMLKKQFPQNQNGICIDKTQFSKLVGYFYEVLKKQCPKDTILETNNYFVKKIFDMYDKNNKKGLDLRQFILCFATCTNSPVKERVRAIITTFKDEDNHISLGNFDKLIKNLSLISSEKIQQKKEAYFQRINKVFNQNEKIHINELQTLLNDDFINQLSINVKSECPNNVKQAIAVYKS